MENREVKINESEYAVSFYLIESNTIAISELTLLGDLGKDYADMIKNKKDKTLFLKEFENVNKVYFFSRLNVPAKLRGQGLGHLLMQKTLEFCETNNAMLINTVNPYGDMNLKELNDFYKKCGMKLVNNKGLLIYSPNIKNEIKKSLKP